MPKVWRIDVMPLDPKLGEWCDQCLLPSRVVVPIVLVDHETLLVIARTEVSGCDSGHR